MWGSRGCCQFCNMCTISTCQSSKTLEAVVYHLALCLWGAYQAARNRFADSSLTITQLIVRSRGATRARVIEVTACKQPETLTRNSIKLMMLRFPGEYPHSTSRIDPPQRRKDCEHWLLNLNSLVRMEREAPLMVNPHLISGHLCQRKTNCRRS